MRTTRNAVIAIASALIVCLSLSGCAAGPELTGQELTGQETQSVSVPPRPATSEEAEQAAADAGLDEEQTLSELHYRINGDWAMEEVDDTDAGDMISRIYTAEGDSASALDVLRKGISLIERDALDEGKRNLGSVGQFTKQWESTYGLSLTQELTDSELPEGADMGWVFESLGEGRGGRGILLIGDMYMYAVYYAAEDSENNTFEPLWDALSGSIWIERTEQTE